MIPAERGAPSDGAATLELREASFRSAGVVTAELSLRTAARRVGLVGEWQPLFRALTAEASLSSGSAQILNCNVEEALARGIVGVAACDPPLPESFTVREYLEHAARLSHGVLARAKEEARRTLEELALTELAPRKLGELLLHERRALGIAFASLTAPAVLCLESPLRGLDADSADYVARLSVQVAEHSVVIVSSALPAAPSAERTLLGGCEELFVLKEGALVAHGAPAAIFAPGSRYLLTVAGANGNELATSLSKFGCALTRQASPTTFGALVASSRPVTRYLVELPEASSSDLLLDTALATGVTVLELEPLRDR